MGRGRGAGGGGRRHGQCPGCPSPLRSPPGRPSAQSDAASGRKRLARLGEGALKTSLSVIVPCFNEEKNLPLLVNRINQSVGQAAIPAEIVLVNDGSRDATGSVIDRLAKQFDNIRPVHHPVNQGIVGGWRSGLKASTGTWVL